MTCWLCRGSLEQRTTTYCVRVGSTPIVVRDVPAEVCGQCGEAVYQSFALAAIARIRDGTAPTPCVIEAHEYQFNDLT
jgi:YgiT-type zinc finger domain-containing protein